MTIFEGDHKTEKFSSEVKLSCDNNFVISSSESNEIIIYDLIDKSCLSKLSGHSKPVVTLDRHPFEDAGLTSGSLDGTIRVWN